MSSSFRITLPDTVPWLCSRISSTWCRAVLRFRVEPRVWLTSSRSESFRTSAGAECESSRWAQAPSGKVQILQIWRAEVKPAPISNAAQRVRARSGRGPAVSRRHPRGVPDRARRVGGRPARPRRETRGPRRARTGWCRAPSRRPGPSRRSPGRWDGRRRRSSAGRSLGLVFGKAANKSATIAPSRWARALMRTLICAFHSVLCTGASAGFVGGRVARTGLLETLFT